jgi:hypothetical protein
LAVEQHLAVASDAPGIGVSFDWGRLEALDDDSHRLLGRA